MNTLPKTLSLIVLCCADELWRTPSSATPPAAAATCAAAPAAANPRSRPPRSEAGEPRANTSKAAPPRPRPASRRADTSAAGAHRPAAAPATAAPGQKAPGATDRLELGTATVTGDREQPKVMYIVPWKKSDIGDLAGKPMNSLVDEILAPGRPGRIQTRSRLLQGRASRCVPKWCTGPPGARRVRSKS